MAIINNVAYSWSMITLSSTALGIDEGSTTLEGVSAIKWSKKRKVESNYGMGGRPVSRGFGNITYTASITMDYATQQLLRSVYGSLLEIGEFDLIISFANPMAGEDWTTTTVTLKGCIFTEDCLESQQDDTNITHGCNFRGEIFYRKERMAHASLPASEAGAVRFGSVFARKPPMGYGATSLYH